MLVSPSCSELSLHCSSLTSQKNRNKYPKHHKSILIISVQKLKINSRQLSYDCQQNLGVNFRCLSSSSPIIYDKCIFYAV